MIASQRVIDHVQARRAKIAGTIMRYDVGSNGAGWYEAARNRGVAALDGSAYVKIGVPRR